MAYRARRTRLHELFGSTPNFDLPVPDGDAPALGTIRSKRAGDLDLRRLGLRVSSAEVPRSGLHAIPEALDDFAFGFGDLSIHEIAMNPINPAYSSYYGSGARFPLRSLGIEEVGHFIDEGGNNFWGVETFISGSRASGDRKRLFAESDRDFGLYIFRYTGPRQRRPARIALRQRALDGRPSF